MAFITDHIRASLFPNLRAFFAGLSKSIDLAASTRHRVTQMERLNAKTDTQLEELGIRREDIARYVFRDILYI